MDLAYTSELIQRILVIAVGIVNTMSDMKSHISGFHGYPLNGYYAKLTCSLFN